jgi:hypothetical protein
MSGVILLTSSQAGLMVSSLRQVLKYVLLVDRAGISRQDVRMTAQSTLISSRPYTSFIQIFILFCEISTAH